MALFAGCMYSTRKVSWYPLLVRTWPLDYELAMFVKLVLDHIQTYYLIQSPQQTASFEIAVTSVGDQAMVLCNLTLVSLMMSSAAGCTMWHSILIQWSSAGNIFVYTLNSSHCFGLNIVPSNNRLCLIYIFNVDNPWKGSTQQRDVLNYQLDNICITCWMAVITPSNYWNVIHKYL